MGGHRNLERRGWTLLKSSSGLCSSVSKTIVCSDKSSVPLSLPAQQRKTKERHTESPSVWEKGGMEINK